MTFADASRCRARRPGLLRGSCFLALALALTVGCSTPSAAQSPPAAKPSPSVAPPKLVLQITVDALTRRALLEGRVAGAPIQDQIRRNFHPRRSGNVHVIADPYWFLHSTKEAQKMGLDGIAAIHGSPWVYDTFVPIFFAGHTVGHGTVYRRVGPHDIASTIAAYLGVKPPAGSIGDPLVEVLGSR